MFFDQGLLKVFAFASSGRKHSLCSRVHTYEVFPFVSEKKTTILNKRNFSCLGTHPGVTLKQHPDSQGCKDIALER